MALRPLLISLAAILSVAGSASGAAPTLELLQVGRAGHAFDHLGGISSQAEAAAASGATVIYATGLGSYGYSGLPPSADYEAARTAVAQYNHNARQHGVELILGYLCATSIINLDRFDDHWPDELRTAFAAPPAQWRQQDRHGNPLPSWYAGDYQPACMNHPDWRAYQRHMVREQLETGHDGVFFDNPTVHPEGCYCRHCMERFAAFLQQRGVKLPPAASGDSRWPALRDRAAGSPREFLEFRAAIARDFLQDMRSFARSIKADALITCNNSLNQPERLYAQCRTHGYNIFQLSQAEDLVVIEDMATQPRREGDRYYEMAPTYRQLQAISHGKPIVAVTIAGGDYHTPPHLVRLAMAEAAAHGVSHLWWPTWPEDQRPRMIAAVRPQADFLRQHAGLLNDASPRADVALLMPFRRWLDVEACRPYELASALSAANIPYAVAAEEAFETVFSGDASSAVVLVESRSALSPDEQAAMTAFEGRGGRVVTADQPQWLAELRHAVKRPGLRVTGPAGVRAIVCDQPGRTIVHLLNLNVQRLSSFDDRVTPAEEIELSLPIAASSVDGVKALSADDDATVGELNFANAGSAAVPLISVKVRRLQLHTIVVMDYRQ